MKSYKTAIAFLVPIAVFILDRAFKWLFVHIWPDKAIALIGQWLSLQLAYNPGVAFGFLLNYWLIMILYLVAFVAFVYFAVIFYSQNKFWQFLALALAMAGAFSNFLDRLYLGRVVDYIDVRYFSILNLADISIVLGLGSLAYLSYRRQKD